MRNLVQYDDGTAAFADADLLAIGLDGVGWEISLGPETANVITATITGKGPDGSIIGKDVIAPFYIGIGAQGNTVGAVDSFVSGGAGAVVTITAGVAGLLKTSSGVCVMDLTWTGTGNLRIVIPSPGGIATALGPLTWA